MKAKTTMRTRAASNRLTDLELSFYCADCGMDTGGTGRHEDYYMVQKALWDEFGAGRAMLCVGCLEGRLGRRLRWSDFTDCLVNERHLSGYGHRYEFDVPEPSWGHRLARTSRSARVARGAEIGGAPPVVIGGAAEGNQQ